LDFIAKKFAEVRGNPLLRNIAPFHKYILRAKKVNQSALFVTVTNSIKWETPANLLISRGFVLIGKFRFESLSGFYFFITGSGRQKFSIKNIKL